MTPRSWTPYVVLAAVLAVALAVGSGDDGRPAGAGDRVDRIAREVRCPTCESQSAADSDAPASEAIRQEIRRRVEAGQTDAEVRSYLVSRYGKDILLKPEASGVAALAWVLPVAAAVCAAAGLGAAFLRWRRPRGPAPSPEDRALVEEARRR